MRKWTSTSVVINSATEEMVKSALKDGWNFEVLTEGEHLCENSTDFDEIMENIHAVDGILEIHIHKAGENLIGVMLYFIMVTQTVRYQTVLLMAT